MGRKPPQCRLPGGEVQTLAGRVVCCVFRNRAVLAPIFLAVAVIFDGRILRLGWAFAMVFARWV